MQEGQPMPLENYLLMRVHQLSGAKKTATDEQTARLIKRLREEKTQLLEALEIPLEHKTTLRYLMQDYPDSDAMRFTTHVLEDLGYEPDQDDAPWENQLATGRVDVSCLGPFALKVLVAFLLESHKEHRRNGLVSSNGVAQIKDHFRNIAEENQALRKELQNANTELAFYQKTAGKHQLAYEAEHQRCEFVSAQHEEIRAGFQHLRTQLDEYENRIGKQRRMINNIKSYCDDANLSFHELRLFIQQEIDKHWLLFERLTPLAQPVDKRQKI